MASDRLSLRLPEPLRSEMENLSETTGRTESNLVREAIEEYLLLQGRKERATHYAIAILPLGC